VWLEFDSIGLSLQQVMSRGKAKKAKTFQDDEQVIILLNRTTITCGFFKNATADEILQKASRYDNCKVFVKIADKESLFGSDNAVVIIYLCGELKLVSL
jgi:hypothetical protein